MDVSFYVYSYNALKECEEISYTALTVYKYRHV